MKGSKVSKKTVILKAVKAHKAYEHYREANLFLRRAFGEHYERACELAGEL